MEPRMPKMSPGGPNGAQEAQMEPRRPNWSPGGPNGAQEGQMEPRRPKCCWGRFVGSLRMPLAGPSPPLDRGLGGRKP